MQTTRRSGELGIAVATAALVLGGCTPGSVNGRPTDPHLITTDAVRATAALSSVRLHLEAATKIDARGLGGQGFGGMVQMGTAMDADVDLASRQLAGRQSTTFSAPPGVPNGFQGFAPQSSEVIVTNAGTFVRETGAARWTKSGGAGLSVGPTNAVIATALVGLLDDARVTYDRADPAACTLGTCDHVIVHLNGPALVESVATLLGVPGDAAAGATMPNVDLDVLVDQKTSVISEIRTSYAMGTQSMQLLLTLANPGDPVQIVAPPPALVDDTLGGFGGGFGGLGAFGGGQVTTILETVGTEVDPPPPTPMPGDPYAEPSAP